MQLRVGFNGQSQCLLNSVIVVDQHDADAKAIGASRNCPADAPEMHDGLLFHRTPGQPSGTPGLGEWQEISALEAEIEAYKTANNHSLPSIRDARRDELVSIEDDQRTVPVGISLIAGATAFEIPWGSIMAASVIVTVPLVALVLVFQKKIVSGLTAGAVKG